MDTERDGRIAASKVPAVTLGFWVIKIIATTLGETGGDTVSMSMGLGYLVGTAIFVTLLLASAGPGIEHPREQGRYNFYLAIKADLYGQGAHAHANSTSSKAMTNAVAD